MRLDGRLLLLAVLLFLPLGCAAPPRDAPSPASWSKPENKPWLDINEILPDDWQHENTYREDTNRDGIREWIILYRFDLREKETSGSPIGAVIYRLDDEDPPNISAHDLHPPDGNYLCECNCKFRLEDVLSGLEGDELVFMDRCNEETSRLSVFQWDSDAKEYMPRGHFTGYHIAIGPDVVTTTERLESRAQLVMVRTYHPDAGRTYYQGNGQSRRNCSKEEMDFCHGEPEDVCCSPYPEKVVLAFYQDYKNDEKALAYFSDSAREHLGQCDAGKCGCPVPRDQITHVRVTYLDPDEPNPADPDRATVSAQVVCELQGGEAVEQPIRWHLIRKDGRWRLEHLE